MRIIKILLLLLFLLMSGIGFAAEKMEVATFAGGCFWCMEPPFEKAEGVVDVISGYSGGKEKNPTYKQVSAGKTGHVESVQVTYDPKKISYGELLDIFWRQIDPTDDGGQFVDRGRQYHSAIFYHNEKQKKEALDSLKKLSASKRYKKPILTWIRPFTSFYPAEDYHQNYYKTSPVPYNLYRYRSGRDKFLDKIWGKDRKKIIKKSGYIKPSKRELKKMLTPIQYRVTQEDGTETPFKNEYWDNKREGIYVDLLSGEPLFSSADKYVSGTGWPSFTRPLEPGNIIEKKERFLFWVGRTEIRSRQGDNHIGHVFNDGPQPTGLRYCMNSAAMRFIPREDLAKEGYGKYLKLLK